MEQIIIDLVVALAPLVKDAIAAKEAKDEARHAAIVQQFNEHVVQAFAAANGLEDFFAQSDADFHERLKALAARFGSV